MSTHGHTAIVVGCTEVLFQPSFTLCCLTRSLPTESEFNALVAVWCGRTEHDAYHDK